MITLNDFIDTECPNSFSKKNMLERIQKLRENQIQKHVFSFNLYDLDIDFKKDEIIISENLFADSEESIKLSIDDFCIELSKYLDK